MNKVQLSGWVAIALSRGCADGTERCRAVVGLLDDGADDVLRKPFGLEELAARCRTLLKRGRSGLQERVTVGPLEVHLLLRQVPCVSSPLNSARVNSPCCALC